MISSLTQEDNSFGVNVDSTIVLVVYTVLVGNKESLNDPLCIVKDKTQTDIELDFICFTDNLNLVSETWEFKLLTFPPLPVEKLSRRPKALPHEYLQEYEYSLYVDNTVVFKRLPCRNDLTLASPDIFRALRHPWRNVPLDEADMVVWFGLDDSQIVNSQIEFCADVRSLSSINHLTAGTILLRSHNTPMLKRFGTVWWEQILAFSRRDQLALDFSLDVCGCTIDYFDGDLVVNDLIKWPVFLDANRIQGNFDSDFYAWRHRDDDSAKHNPKGHFLTHGNPLDRQYDRKVSWFEYLCRRFSSSLGSFVPPRRSLAPVIEPLLYKLIRDTASLLVVRVESNSIFAFDELEATFALIAIESFYKFKATPKINYVSLKEDSFASDVVFTSAYGITVYDAVIILGAPVSYAIKVVKKFIFIINKARGCILLHLCGRAPLDVIDKVREIAKIHANVSIDIYSSNHVESTDSIPNSVIIVNYECDAQSLD
jgi:hypothetical protein